MLHIYDVIQETLTTVPESEGMWTCRWSPKGGYLSALTIKNGELELFDRTTKKWRSLAVDHVENSTWSHDERFIYYHTQGSLQVLRRVRVSDGRVDNLKDLERYPVAAKSWSGLSPDDSPILLHDVGTEEIYALKLSRRPQAAEPLMRRDRRT